MVDLANNGARRVVIRKARSVQHMLDGVDDSIPSCLQSWTKELAVRKWGRE